MRGLATTVQTDKPAWTIAEPGSDTRQFTMEAHNGSSPCMHRAHVHMDLGSVWGHLPVRLVLIKIWGRAPSLIFREHRPKEYTQP